MQNVLCYCVLGGKESVEGMKEIKGGGRQEGHKGRDKDRSPDQQWRMGVL